MGAYVRAERERRGLTQATLALKVGISRAYLSQIESGKVGLSSAGVRRAIAAELGLRHVDLMVAAGELTEDEVAPPIRPTYPDDRLRLLAENWGLFSTERREFIAQMVRWVRRDHGLEDETEPVVAVNRVAR